ncbi:MAG: hypothetical protein H6742_05310 [Alphaproteobacteria bacterium]|nr:hypothetical protein [Alphaproteobacteria bacterium]
MTRRLLSIMVPLFLALGVAAPTDAAAQQRRPPAGAPAEQPVKAKVELQIRVVYATDAHSKKDPRLASLTRYLGHLRFTGYELLDTQTSQVGLGGKATFAVEGGRKVTVELLGRDESRARVRVQVAGSSGNKLLDTTMSVNRNATVIVAGPKHEQGILVLPLTARY